MSLNYIKLNNIFLMNSLVQKVLTGNSLIKKFLYNCLMNQNCFFFSL